MSTIKESNNGPAPLAAARMHLSAAVNRSREGLEHHTAERLQYAHGLVDDHHDLEARIDDVTDGDVTTSEARKQIREIMQLIDAKEEFTEGLDL